MSSIYIARDDDGPEYGEEKGIWLYSKKPRYRKDKVYAGSLICEVKGDDKIIKAIDIKPGECYVISKIGD